MENDKLLSVIVGLFTLFVSVITWLNYIVNAYEKQEFLWAYLQMGIFSIIIMCCIYFFLKKLGEKKKKREKLDELKPLKRGDGAPIGRNDQKTLLIDFLKEKDDDAKLSVLTGESGCGKTSFVEAEIIPELEKDNCSVIKLEQYEDYPKLVQQKLNEIFHNSKNIDLENSLVDCANKVISYNKTPVFIFDQFEQVFMGDPDLKEKLTEAICILLKQKKSLKVVIVVRSESFKNTMMLFSKKTVLCNCGLSNCKRCQIINLPLLRTEEAIDFIEWVLKHQEVDRETCKTVVDDLNKLSPSKNEILPVSLRIVSSMMKRENILSIKQYKKHGMARGLQTEYIDFALKSLHKNKIASRAIFSLSDPSKGSVALTKDLMADIAQTSKKDMETAASEMLDIGLIKKTAKKKYRIVHEYIAALLLEQGSKFISPIELQEFQMRRKVFFSGGRNALEDISRIQESPTKKNRMLGYSISGLGMMILLYRILVFDETQPYWIDITFTPAFIVGMGVALLTYHYYVNFLSRMMKNEGIIGKICSCIGSIVFLIAVGFIYFKPQSWPFIVAVLFCFGSLKDWQLAYWSKLSPHLSYKFLYWGISMFSLGVTLFLFGVVLNKMKHAIEITSIWNEIFAIEIVLAFIISGYLSFGSIRFYSLTRLRPLISRANIEILQLDTRNQKQTTH